MKLNFKKNVLSCLLLVIKNVLSSESDYGIYPSLPVIFTQSENRQCQSDSKLLLEGFKTRQLWAMKIWDSSAHGVSGVLYGSTAQLGNFDECLSVETPIKTQYCVVKIAAISKSSYLPLWKFIQDSSEDRKRLPLDEINYGLCVPASCRGSDLENSLNDFLMNGTKTDQDALFRVQVPELLCTTKEEQQFTPNEIAFMIFCIIVLVSVVMGTIIDYASADKKTLQFFRCFSLKSNFNQLFEDRHDDRKHPLAVLHGVKALSIVGILYGHRFGILLALATYNYRDVEYLRSQWFNWIVTQMDLVVDTFFFISGLLVAYFLVDLLAKRSAFSVILIRIVRISPIYYFFIWLSASVFWRLGSGPFWNFIQTQERDFCIQNWWTGVFFVNNYVNPTESCMIHSWYLACDMHFFLVTVFLIIILIKSFNLGISILTFLTVFSSILPGLMVYFYKLDPLVLFFNDFLQNPRASIVFELLYTKSHNRVTVYLMGVLFGIFLNRKKDSKIKFSGALSLCLSLLALCIILVVMFLGSLYYVDREEISLINSALFSILRRPLWACGLSIFLLVHRFGPQTFWSKLLSSRPAYVLSKLVYSVYLVHYLLITATMAKKRVPHPFSLFDTIVQGSGDLFTSYFYGCLLYVMLELPIKRILREILFPFSLRSKANPPKEIVTMKL